MASFNLPSQISIEAIGALRAGMSVLDVGAGPNVNLLEFVHSQGGRYTALDKNADFLEKQKVAGAQTIVGDIRNLPLPDADFDICHVRFVISHLGHEKQQAIEEVLRVTKSQGRAIFIDYDWATAHGSRTFNEVKEFMIHGGFLFDADFGGELEALVSRTVPRETSIAVSQTPVPQMTDYAQVLKLREAGATDLKLQGKESSVTRWNEILDELQEEADSNDPPGFFFPGVTTVIVTKK